MQQIALDIGIRPAPDLAHFLPGPNELALLQLQAWLDSVGELNPTPLYLWGDAASGKTYLLQAARHALKNRGLRSGWMDAYSPEQAFDEDWAAIFLDDVDLYNSSQQAQAFAWLAQAQALHIPALSCGHRAPAQLHAQLREDLRNRLAWGHVQSLQVLSEAERRAVLWQEADARGIVLSDEVLNFILKYFSRDLASLMQLLEQIDGYALSSKRAVTIPLIKAMLQE